MCLYPKQIFTRPLAGDGQLVTVSCGKCLQCLQQKSLEWSFRIMDEASQYSENCFITLTYNDDNLPSDGSVSRREVQLFVKRLRKALKPLRVRFFACGEYGKKLLRPHYHIIVFNWFPSDAWFWQKDKKDDLFRSPLLERVWKKGFSSVGKLTLESAKYCAKYMNKFQFDRRLFAQNSSRKLCAPFVQMSNRPGIGYNSVYASDLVSDRIYRSGKSVKIPRYYLDVMERDGVYLEDFKDRRMAHGELVSRCTDLSKLRKKYHDIFLKK